MLARLQKLKSKKGFTLVELIVVIAIIAILAAVLIPVIGNYVADANDAAEDQTLKEIETSFGIEISEMGNPGERLGTGTITVASDGAGNVSVTGATVTDAPAGYDFAANMVIRLKSLAAGTYTVTIGDLNGDAVLQSVAKA